jgi:hypothetical protein
VEADFVVDLFDKFLQVLLQLVEAAVAASIDLFPLERLDEALALAVFPRPGGPAHAQMRAAGFQPLYVFVACILGTAIGVMHPTRWRLAAGDGRLQSCQRQSGL